MPTPNSSFELPSETFNDEGCPEGWHMALLMQPGTPSGCQPQARPSDDTYPPSSSPTTQTLDGVQLSHHYNQGRRLSSSPWPFDDPPERITGNTASSEHQCPGDAAFTPNARRGNSSARQAVPIAKGPARHAVGMSVVRRKAQTENTNIEFGSRTCPECGRICEDVGSLR